MHLAYATSPLNHLVPPSGRVRSREGLQKIYPQNLQKKEKQEKKRKQRNKKSNTHNKYIRWEKLYTFNRLYHPYNSSISLYTSNIYISRYFDPMNGIQTPVFHPTMHQKPTDPSWCSTCKCIHHHNG